MSPIFSLPVSSLTSSHTSPRLTDTDSYTKLQFIDEVIETRVSYTICVNYTVYNLQTDRDKIPIQVYLFACFSHWTLLFVGDIKDQTDRSFNTGLIATNLRDGWAMLLKCYFRCVIFIRTFVLIILSYLIIITNVCWVLSLCQLLF